MNNRPHIVIITRTHNRPNGYIRNVFSVKNQSYKNITHFTICDNTNDILNYVSKISPIETIISVNNDECMKLYGGNTNPNTGKLTSHNLYFNYFQDNYLPSNCYIIYMDDDDFLHNTSTVQELVDMINQNDEDTLYLFKMNLMGNIIPEIVDDENKPKLGTIGGSCIMFHSKWRDVARWDMWKCGDFRVIDKLFKIIPKYKFIDKVVVVSPLAGNGNGIDIK